MIKSPVSRALALAVSIATSFTTASALVISEGEIYGKGAATQEQAQQPQFPLAGNSVMIAQGSGVYLGDGWVLTSTHVGCAPVRFANGNTLAPDKNTWSVLESRNGKPSDVAIFRLAKWEQSDFLKELPTVRISHEAPTKGDRVVLAATGYVQSGERKPLTINGEKIATQGVYLKQERDFLFGATTISRVQEKLVKTNGGLETASFVTRFGRDAGEAQATAGDSGGAAFRFNEATREWEVVGVIFAVSHRARFVPHSAKTYIGSLADYREQVTSLTSESRPIATTASTVDANG
ncbi:trypsin-like peptidase domain-containing protein [Sulfuriroseicoccus oceanibius]|uniref:Trypsin-like peptidase domain-containing protein n=1 Tax=Sulfuriroseicoccus oceanibius TaxID=2707525 RepID=A0A6B3L5C4_9BACT|nr:trypsin-like peptidase domain-containing protein [Sulfuriroseicoccus oceanibius]QQL44540.1 trypsin-like peptidase domain-containing protein [Sulfuriroseicoccus oceanibius]